MTARLGIGVGRSEVRAMIVRDGKAVWRASHPCDGSHELADVVVKLLSTAPIGRIAKPPVVAAFSPALTQVKRLSGLPSVDNRAVASQILRGNPGRFFLRNGVPLAAADAYWSNGAWWGAILEGPAVAAVEEACKRLRLRLDGCIPTVAALAHVVVDGCAAWEDNGTSLSVIVRRGAWVEVTRNQPRDSGGQVHPALARLAPDAQPFADAFAATCCTSRSPLLLRSSRRGAGRRAAIRFGLATLAALAMSVAGLGPGLAASRQIARDTPRLEALRKEATRSASALYDLDAASAGLAEIGRFTEGRRSMVLLLAAMSDALPDSSAIVTLRVDSAAGSVMLLSTSAAAIIPELAGLEEMVEPKILGAVTREAIGAAQFQRISIRFGFPMRRTATPARLPR